METVDAHASTSHTLWPRVHTASAAAQTWMLWKMLWAQDIMLESLMVKPVTVTREQGVSRPSLSSVDVPPGEDLARGLQVP